MLTHALLFQPVSISLDSILPADYPNTVPELKISSSEGLTEAQLGELLELAGRLAEENLGMAMIYTIAEEMQGWLLDHNKPQALGTSMHASMLRRAQAAEQAEEDAAAAGGTSSEVDAAQKEKDEEEERNRQKVLEGTPVTAETFASWNASFMVEIGAEQIAAQQDAPQKKNGRAYFQAASADEDWVDQELSGDDEDDEDLEDLSDIDDDDDHDDDDDDGPTGE